MPELLTALEAVPDPRASRGRRYRLPSLIAVALCAVSAGARSFDAIADWAAGVPRQLLQRCGIRFRVPSPATIRQVFGRLDGDALDRVLDRHLAARCLREQCHAEYVIVVKANQPGLLARARDQPWEQVPVVWSDPVERGHRREEHRSCKIPPWPGARGLRFPYVQQVIQIIRRRRALGAHRGGVRDLLTMLRACTSEVAGFVDPRILAHREQNPLRA